MNRYLLDENVIREFWPGGHRHVLRWLASVDDNDLRISVMTLLEKRNGGEARKKKDKAAGDKILAAIDAFEKAFEGRIVPFDQYCAAELARLLAGNQKHRTDLALAATAKVHDFVLVTRNTKDVLRSGARLLNPFENPPEVIEPA